MLEMPGKATPCARDADAAHAGPEDGASAAYLYAIVMVAAVGGFLFGYDLSLISGAIIFLKTEFALTPFWFGVVAGSAILGCPFGTVGRRMAFRHLGKKTHPDSLFLPVLAFDRG